MHSARCGHGHYDSGHCARPGCPNDYRACPDCRAANDLPEQPRAEIEAWARYFTEGAGNAEQ